MPSYYGSVSGDVIDGSGDDILSAIDQDSADDLIFGGDGADTIYANGNGYDGYVEYYDAAGVLQSTLHFTEIETTIP